VNLGDNAAALNYGQETISEDIALSSLLDQPAGGADPNLSGTATITGFVDGAGNSAAVTHNEVGIIEIAANHADGNYLGVAGAIGKSGYVGRFTPDHFTLSAGMISNRVDSSCAPASTFTYMEENQRLEFTLTAQNVSNNTTLNYTGAFAYLDLNSPANLNIGAIDTVAPTPLTSRIALTSSSGAWVNGVANPVFATISLDRNALMANNGPFTNLNWGIAPVDQDGVQMGSYNLDVDNDATDDHTLIVANEVRFGRAFVESTSGSELLPLVLPLRAEYWNGTQFILNTNDSCTTYNAAALTYSNPVPVTFGVTTNGATGTLDQGEYGTIDPPILVSSNAQQTGSICIAHTVPGYLRFNWAANPSLACIDPDGDPSAKATFGIFDFNTPHIYTREVY
jgi:MSHA biogenesis protein MshQ